MLNYIQTKVLNGDNKNIIIKLDSLLFFLNIGSM